MRLSAEEFGPALFAPVMVAVSAAYSPWQHRDTWMAWPIVLGLPVLAVWHLALFVERPGKRAEYLLYAVINLVCYLCIGIVCLGAVTGDAL